MSDRQPHPFNPDPGARELCMCGQYNDHPLHDPYREPTSDSDRTDHRLVDAPA